MDQNKTREINLFTRLTEIMGFISREDSIRVKSKTNESHIISSLIQQGKLNQQVAQLIWQLVQISPILKQEEVKGSSSSKQIKFESLSPKMQQDLLFAEKLISQSVVSPQEVNECLKEMQKTQGNISLGQILIRKRFITSDQFVFLKQQASQPKFSQELSIDPKQGTVIIAAISHPENIDRYEIIREIARGGMGVVYEAKDPDLNKIVALKTIIAGEAADNIDIERFKREAKLTAELKHPNIVQIHEIGKEGNQHFFTMDYIDGSPLDEYIKENKPSLRQIVKIIMQVASALGHAHIREIIHRDIKPGNILMDKKGNPSITDFGLARQQGGKDGLTMSGVALGTPAYMSPEQAEGRIRDIDIRSDIYSLGAVFYELLAGQPPFSGNSLAEILRAVISQLPPPLRQIKSDIPQQIDTICMKCLEKDKTRRYNNCKALERDLDRFLKGGTIKAKEASIFDKGKQWLALNKALGSALVAAVFLMFVSIAMFFKSSSLIHGLQKKLKVQKTTFAQKNQELNTNLEDLKLKLAQRDKNLRERDVELLKFLVVQADLTRKLQKYEESYKLYNRAIALDPNLARAYLGRAHVFVQQGKNDLAMRDLTRAKSLASGDQKILKACNSLFSAIKSFKKIGGRKIMILQRGQEQSLVLEKRGVQYIAQKRYLDAISVLTKAIAIRNDIPTFYDHRGYAYLQTGNLQASLRDCEKAISLDPRNHNFYNHHGVVLASMGRFPEAFNSYNKSLQISPLNIRGLINRASLYEKTKRYKEALRDYESCFDIPKYRTERLRNKILELKKLIGGQ